jgi:type IV pilus assembly protein PilO
MSRLNLTIIFFLIVAVMAATLLWPKFQDLQISRKNLEEKKDEFQNKEEYLMKLTGLRNSLKEYQTEFSKIGFALPDNPSLPSLFSYLQETSSESGLVLERISPFSLSSSQNFPGLQETIFSIEVSGVYSSFKNFLSLLEKSARLIEIENISFSSGGDDESFAFDLKIKVHSY